MLFRSLQCAEQALAIQQHIKGEYSTECAEIYKMMADLYTKQKNHKAALKCRNKIKDITFFALHIGSDDSDLEDV